MEKKWFVGLVFVSDTELLVEGKSYLELHNKLQEVSLT